MSSILAFSKRFGRVKIAALAPLAFLSGLTACASGTVFGPDRLVDDLYSYLSYGAPQNEAQVDVYGNPFALSQEALGQAVVEGFTGGVKYGPPLTFSTYSKTAHPGYRFVVAFGADAALSGNDLCTKKESDLKLAPKDRPFRMKTAYCVKERAFTEVSGLSDEIGDPQSLEFKRWMWHTMQAMTPPPVKTPSVKITN